VEKEEFSGTQDQSWTDGNTYWLSIGQEFIGITPLEVANAYAAIANGGTLYQPQMVKSIVDVSRNIIEEKSRWRGGKILSTRIIWQRCAKACAAA
jgi:Cell division protein FtsI/penicillin-binding protein 2